MFSKKQTVGQLVSMKNDKQQTQVVRGGRRFWLGSIILVMAGSSLAWAQAPAGGIDPVIIRMNGWDAVTEDVIPVVWSNAGLDEVNLTNVFLMDQNGSQCINFANISIPGPFGPINFGFLGTFCFCVRVRADLPFVDIALPVDEDTVNASFLTAPAGSGTINAQINMPNGSVDARLRVRTNGCTSLPDWIPSEIEDIVNGLLTQTLNFDFGVNSLNLAAQATVTRSGSSLIVSSLPVFTPAVGAVTFPGAAQLQAIADLVNISRRRFFNQPSNLSITQLAAAVLNGIIANNVVIKDGVQDVINDAIRDVARARGNSVSLPNTDALPVSVGMTLANFSTANPPNMLESQWTMTLAATGATVALPFTYQYLARAGAPQAPSGDLQALLPLTLFDKSGFELARKGWFNRTITVPAMTIQSSLVTPPATITTPSFAVQTSPTGMPRALAVAGQPTQIKLQLPMSIVNASTGNVPQLSNVAATVEVVMAFNTLNNALRARVVAVNVPTLTGTVSFGGRSINVSAFRTQLQTTLNTALNSAQPALTLLPRVTNVTSLGNFSIFPGAITVGTKYVSVPLNGY